MRIVQGTSAIDREDHAKNVVKKINGQLANPERAREAVPFGVAHHLAAFPHACDDCGQTYWTRDEWGGPHLGCQGFKKSPGF